MGARAAQQGQLPRAPSSAIVAESDLVTALPRQFALRNAPRYPENISAPSFPFLSSPLRAVVPEVATRDGGIAWLLELLGKSAKAATKPR